MRYHRFEAIGCRRLYSGAEGTIIEEPDNVAQMIWGLGPDDQPHNQIRAEGPPSHPDNAQNPPLYGSSQVPPRLQKKRIPTQQVPKSSRAQISTHASHAKPSLARTQRQAHDDKRTLLSQGPSYIETHQDIDIVTGLPWNEGQSMPASIGACDNPANDPDVFPVDNNRILEWQLARLRHALRTSLADMESYSTYPGRLEPVIPAAMTPGFPQSHPRIFVEPRPNEPFSPATRISPVELAQQYRQQQLYRQALQKQKLQVQSILPTPPNSSSPQWSSHFSPYLTYCSTFSPELVGSVEHPVSVPSQKYRSSANASQYLRHVYEHSNTNDIDTSANIPSVKTPQIAPNFHSASSLRQTSSSSSTLAKYIKQLQALSPIAHFSPLQPLPPSNVPLAPLSSTDESPVGPFQSVYHSPAVPTPPSPESPQSLSQGSSYHNSRSMASTRPVQRRLPSVPEEDGTLLELSTSVSAPKLQNHVTTSSSPSSHDGTTRLSDATRKTIILDLPEFENNLVAPPMAFHETSPVKVRLPVNKEHNIREQANGYHEQSKGHQHGSRKKPRYKKLKGPTPANERAPTRGLVG